MNLSIGRSFTIMQSASIAVNLVYTAEDCGVRKTSSKLEEICNKKIIGYLNFSIVRKQFMKHGVFKSDQY